MLPVLIRMRTDDNVAIVGNDGGLAAGTLLPGGVTLREKVPQAHKVALVNLVAGADVVRYGVVIGRAPQSIAAGSWVHERLLEMPAARALTGLPMATMHAPVAAPLEGYTFEGYRNADGSVGTRNLLAITTTVQCVAGVLEVAIERIKSELLPRYPNVDGVVGLEHTYGCGVAIEAPGAEIPIRTLRHISQNPNFGGEVMVLSLGCEKLQPERLLPNLTPRTPAASAPQGGVGSSGRPSGPRTFALVDERNVADVGSNADAGFDLVRLQDEHHVGFQSMIDSILATAKEHLERLNTRRRETEIGRAHV